MAEPYSKKLEIEQQLWLEKYEEDPAGFFFERLLTLFFDHPSGLKCRTEDCDNCPGYLAHEKMMDDIEAGRFKIKMELVITEYAPSLPVYRSSYV